MSESTENKTSSNQWLNIEPDNRSSLIMNKLINENKSRGNYIDTEYKNLGAASSTRLVSNKPNSNIQIQGSSLSNPGTKSNKNYNNRNYTNAIQNNFL